MKQVKHLRKKVNHLLNEYGMVYTQMNEKSSGNGLTVIFDDKIPSAKLKTLNHSLKEENLNCTWSFCPETWELALTISI